MSAHKHIHVKPHAHEHHAVPRQFGQAFALAVALNAFFVVVEFVYGVMANSTALMADAGHNLSDVLGLALAWGATILVRRAPSSRFTYGLRSTSILAALANAMVLLIACGAIAWEALQRFAAPPPVAGNIVMTVATIGIAVNAFSAWLFMAGRREDLNIRGAYLHMAADAAVSLGVLISGLIIKLTHWYRLDPIMSLAVLVVIVGSTWRLLREAVQLALSAVPAHIDLAAVESYLRCCSGVAGIHDLHIWGMSTTESALTVHLVMPGGYPGDQAMDDIMHTLQHRFAIQHSTLQVELGTSTHACVLYEEKPRDG